MTEHTPRPWRAEQLSAGYYRILAKQGPLNFAPAAVHGEANARLIAAAPDLLAALKEMLPYGEKHLGLLERTRGGKAAADSFRQDVEQARAAIAKAEDKS